MTPREKGQRTRAKYEAVESMERMAKHFLTYWFKTKHARPTLLVNMQAESRALMRILHDLDVKNGFPERDRALAEKIAAKLFCESRQLPGKRLVVETKNDKFDGGGWCKQAVIDTIFQCLQEG